MVDAPAEAVAQFGVVELGEDAPPERRIVDRAQLMDGLGNLADFGERAGQGGAFVADLERAHDAGCLQMAKLERADLVVHRDTRQTPRVRAVLTHITEHLRQMAPKLYPADAVEKDAEVSDEQVQGLKARSRG